MSIRPSWTAWALQVALGAVVGAILGAAGLSRHPRWYLLVGDSPLLGKLLFVLGAVLLVSGLAGRYGDRLWLGRESSIPEAHLPRRAEQASSVMLTLGIVLLALGLGLRLAS